MDEATLEYMLGPISISRNVTCRGTQPQCFYPVRDTVQRVAEPDTSRCHSTLQILDSSSVNYDKGFTDFKHYRPLLCYLEKETATMVSEVVAEVVVKWWESRRDQAAAPRSSRTCVGTLSYHNSSDRARCMEGADVPSSCSFDIRRKKCKTNHMHRKSLHAT
jgi:hypothetical protein